jgi:hypothetical protein
MNRPSQTEKNRNYWVMGWLTLVFLVVAVIFARTPNGSGIPIPESVQVSAEDISTTPRFTVLGDDAITKIEGFDRNCMDCHEIFDTQPRSKDLLQHKNIKMAHGLNGRCVNCHDAKDRDKLVLRDGERVGFSESPMLCAQCHGTTYRQWDRGVHGKTLGYWDKSQGESRRLVCVECHDPHAPRFSPIAPLPAPNTMRMGDQSGETHHSASDKHSPLSRGYELHRSNQNPQPTEHE